MLKLATTFALITFSAVMTVVLVLHCAGLLQRASGYDMSLSTVLIRSLPAFVLPFSGAAVGAALRKKAVIPLGAVVTMAVVYLVVTVPVFLQSSLALYIAWPIAASALTVYLWPHDSR